MYIELTRPATEFDEENYIITKELTIEGDSCMKRQQIKKAIDCYTKALETANQMQKKYLIPRIMACYRRQNLSWKAKVFLQRMIYAYGNNITDHVIYTVLASVHGDLNEWEQAQICADKACKLNEGEIDRYLDAVYARIEYNVSKREGLCLA